LGTVDRQTAYSRISANRSIPFHPSGGPLAAILPVLSRRLQFPIPLGVNLRLTPSERAVLVLTIIDPQK
jgi:hypothetical protein